ncbi:MAG: radical SAM protein, partial [Candidatus Omnitrophica bacterium]|nr:radical SAM protein [Candidatus Omnitrophota bacterium]
MSLITIFDPWKSNLCSCPDKFSLSPYTGCSHGCLYCYASSYIRNFSIVRQKKDFLKRLSSEVKKLPPSSILAIANSSDPYLAQEEQLRLTRGALLVLKNYDLKINIVTKSALIIRDIEILKSLKKILVSFTLTTLDQTLSKKLEPRASLPKERLTAMG